MQRWWIGDPAHPERPAHEVAYPAAGTDNAWVSLHVVRLDTAGLPGTDVEIGWDRQRFAYLADVRWASPDRLLADRAVARPAHARSARGRRRDRRTTVALARRATPAWVELVPGVPAELPDGRLVTAADRDGARRLLADGEALTPADLQVRSVVACRAGTITFLANPIDDPTVQHVWRWTIGATAGRAGQLAALTTEPGMHTASTGGAVVVVRRSSVGCARRDRPSCSAGRRSPASPRSRW